MLKTPRPLGCSWSIVQQQGPITLLGWSPRRLLNRFATHMTWSCGGVCAQSSRVEQEADVRGAASMPLVLGGAGLRSALRVREPARPRRQLGTSRAHWGSTHRVGRRRCTERAHPIGTQRISCQGPSGKVGSTKQVLLSRQSSARRCSLDCRTRNKL